MARRKTGFLSDGSDSDDAASDGEDDYNSQDDADSRAERSLFEYNGRKRRKMVDGGGKAAAWEGIFGEEEEPSRRGVGSGRGGRGGKDRPNWTKPPAFVSKTNDVEDEQVEADPSDNGTPVEMDDANGSSDEDTSTDDDDKSRSPSPRIRDDEDVDRPARMGMGLGARAAFTSYDSGERPSEESGREKGGGRRGIGFKAATSNDMSETSTPGPSTPTGGLGSSHAPQNPITEAVDAPTSFGRRPVESAGSTRTQLRFGGRPQLPTTNNPTQLTASERAHFSSISGSIGAKLLSRMGWEAGKGLGVQEDGRAVPVAVGPQMRGSGIRSGIRTEDSKREARRRGEKISDDEEEKPRRGHKKERNKAEPVEAGWKRQKKVKVKVEHKTYEQLLAEAGDQAASGVGLVIDARGGELKEVSSLSALSLSSWTPTSDAKQLPELRHNLRLVVDSAKGDVEALAREGKSVNERRKWSLQDEKKARSKIDEAEHQLSRLDSIHAITAEIALLASQADHSLATLSSNFEKLVEDYKNEYVAYQLDDVVVGAIGIALRASFAEWEPFDLSSDLLLSALKQWEKAYNLPTRESSAGRHTTDKEVLVEGGRLMTAWESLLWTLWLPKVRSVINNDWNATSPNDAVHLLESWDPILPAFIRENVIDQLILPKVKKAVEEWDARPSRSGKKQRSLAGIVFPWLPLLGERVDEILEGAKRRIRSVMRNWVVKDGVPSELARWKSNVYSSSEWDKLMLQYVIPKLGVCLREDFSINPAQQDMIPFTDWIMPWHGLLRSSMFSHLIQVEFFPKWLDTLYLWLVHPGYKPDEVATWFTWWKSQFPETALSMPGIEYGFTKGLELMNEAMQLGSQASNKLQKPVFKPMVPKSNHKNTRSSTPVRKPAPAESTDITFRTLAEDYASQHDLIFLPLGRSEPQTGKPLFKVSKSADGKKGVTLYVGQDAVFAQEDSGVFRAISLEEMVKRGST